MVFPFCAKITTLFAYIPRMTAWRVVTNEGEVGDLEAMEGKRAVVTGGGAAAAMRHGRRAGIV
jgi:hypothetical protein